MAPAWAWTTCAGSSYLFIEANNCRLKFFGLATAVVQVAAIAMIYFVLAEEDGGLLLESSYEYNYGEAPPSPPELPPGPPTAPSPPSKIKNSEVALHVSVGILCIFVMSFLAKDYIRGVTCLQAGSVLMGGIILIVMSIGSLASVVYAIKEAYDDDQNFSPAKVILESVTVLLVLDLDEKVYEAAEAYLGEDRLAEMIGKDEAPGTPKTLYSMSHGSGNVELNSSGNPRL